MRILAMFLLSSVFVFLPTPCHAQDCGHSSILWDHDEQSVLNDLEQRQDCLNKKLQSRDDAYLVNGLDDRLTQSDRALRSAELKIESLEATLHLVERRLSMAEEEIEWLSPKATSRKPKARVSKPTPGSTPDTPATTTHPESEKPVSRPMPSSPRWNDPTPAVKHAALKLPVRPRASVKDLFIKDAARLNPKSTANSRRGG